MLSFTHSGLMLLLSGAVIGLGYGSIVPCMQTLAIQKSAAHRSVLQRQRSLPSLTAELL